MLDAVPAATVTLRDALIDSRARWRDLVAISADAAFETGVDGRFTFLAPDDAFGWAEGALLGQSSAVLLAPGAGFNPFEAQVLVRDRLVWLRRQDGVFAPMQISAGPILSGGGRAGARGTARTASQHGDMLHLGQSLYVREMTGHILARLRAEVTPRQMVLTALRALAHALGADGALMLDGLAAPEDPPLHASGGDAPTLRRCARAQNARYALAAYAAAPAVLHAPEGETGLIFAAPTRFGDFVAVLLWRGDRGWGDHGRGDLGRHWGEDDGQVLAAVMGALCAAFEQDAIQRELALQARTDPLTGLFNRQTFVSELERRVARLDREALPGSLMLVDIDQLDAVNERHGPEDGDACLSRIAMVLRDAARPSDLLGRLGGDEFAIWFDGMDELAAAERANRLCLRARAERGPACPAFTIGVAGRWPGADLDGAALLRRAGAALARAKRAGAGTWHVFREDGRDAV